MTVLPRSHDQRSHRSRRTRRDDPEPRLAELLDDPVLRALMTRDGVSRRRLDALIDDTRLRLGIVPVFAATLFAECHAA